MDLLQSATPYELGEGIASSLNFVCILPAYSRGEAYLGAKQAFAAASGFKKILDHRGLVSNCWTGALTPTSASPALTLSLPTSPQARTNYRDFPIALWKDADPDIPILLAAKAEYAKLQ